MQTGKYLLDTNILSDLIKYPGGLATQKVRQIANDDLSTSVIVAGELRFGGRKKNSAKLSHQLETILKTIRILPLTEEASHTYAKIRVGLESKGKPIGSNDLWLAAQAQTHDLILVTANVREFSRVPGLKIENWLASKN